MGQSDDTMSSPGSDRSGDSGPDDLTERPERTLSSFVPILSWLPRYSWGSSLVRDAVAGITLAALLVPESLGYAGVAGVSPELGLYAALAAAVAYAVMGGSRILVVSTAAGVSAVTSSVITELTDDIDPAVAAAALAGASGLILLVAGLLRIGWIVNFISRPVLEAFVAGLCISIIIGQLGKLVGAEVEGESPIEKFGDLVGQVADWDTLTVAIGVAAIATLLLLERFARKVPCGAPRRCGRDRAGRHVRRRCRDRR